MIRNILEYLEITARRVPDRVAFLNDKESLTFAQTKERAKAVGTLLARSLPARGAVALVMDGRSLSFIPAMLGVLYAGGAYAPLDLLMPPDRLRTVLSLLSPAFILADEKGRKALLAAQTELPVVSYEQAAAAEPVEELLQAVRAESSIFDPLSILFTSGSTGVPKGSVQSHASYISYTEATNEVYGFTESTLFGNQSPFFYANSIIDIFPPLALGATVYLFPSGILSFPQRMIDLLAERKVTELTMTPSSFIALAQSEALKADALPLLKYGIMSGEAMPWQPLKKWMEAAPNADFYNFYGSTEMFSVAVGRVSGPHGDGELLPVGKPFDRVHILFTDEEGREVKRGEAGEMLISNPWLSSGYHRDAVRSEAAFVVDPLDRGYYERFYRTGDMGRINEKGELLVLGRRDAQIKHHGYRMELSDTEGALRAMDVLGCVLFDGEKLYCFYTGALSQKELVSGLKGKLQRYMLPDVYIHLDELPYTATMKIDRMTLRRTYMQPNNQ